MHNTSRYFSSLILLALLTALIGLPWIEPCKAEMGAGRTNEWFINMEKYLAGAHGSLACEECHGTMKHNGRYHPDLGKTENLLKRSVDLFDFSVCKKCHRRSYERYLFGEHAKALRKIRTKGRQPLSEDKPAPTCGDCHDAHYEKPYLTRTQIGAMMTEVCGSCHLAQKQTYLNDFHGRRAVRLSYGAAAYCTDCHGAHTCVSLKDKERALAVCQRCHPDAQLKFVGYVVHPTLKGIASKNKEKEEKVKVISVVAMVMGILVALIVIFFYSHSLLWLLRELHERLRKH